MYLEMAERATDGPWDVSMDEEGISKYVGTDEYGDVARVIGTNRDNNAQFIIASRTEGPWMAQQLLKALDLLERQVKACMVCGGTGGVPSQEYGDPVTHGAPYACYVCSDARQFLEGGGQ